ncbi:MAG: hypothetical protein V3V31_11600 [Methylococcales bacterium]
MNIKLYPILLSCCLCAESQAQPDWTPLSLTDFTKNASDSWIAPPNGTSGAPRQGWLNTVDGFFTKEWHLSAAYKKDTQDTYTGTFQFQTPLARRLWMGIDMPFVVNKGDETDFGDVGLTLKTMFHETQDLSVSGGLGVRFATGDKATGGDAWGLFPHVSAWSDVGNGWSLRGGVGIDVLPDKNTKPHYTFSGNFAVGHTITPHSALLGDFTYYVAANLKVPLDDGQTTNLSLPQVPGVRGQTGGQSLDNVTVSLTPGIRTHIADNAFILLGVELPVTNPDPFDYQVNLLLVKGF